MKKSLPPVDNSVWTVPSGTPTFYLAYQGITDAQTQFVEFIGNHSMLTSTGETALLTTPGILTIPRENLWTYPEIQEINRHKPFSVFNNILQFFRQILTTSSQDAWRKATYVPPYPMNETGSIRHFSIDLNKSSLGQKTDTDAHFRKYQALMSPETNRTYSPDNNVVLYGVSRGAATTFSALAEHRDTYRQVKLCVLEAPPATINGVFKGFLFNILWLAKFLYQKLAKSIFGHQHSLDRHDQAVGHVNSFPDSVPLVIISSRQDEVVPHRSALSLALQVAGNRVQRLNACTTPEQAAVIAPVYVLQLDEVGHNAYAKGKERLRYQHFLHAIYRKHQLPYVEAYANAGEHELAVAELTRGIISSQVTMQKRFKELVSRRQEIREEAVIDFNNKVFKPLIPKDTTETQTLALHTQQLKRAVKLCSALPLYAKPLHENRWFQPTAHVKQLQQMSHSLDTLKGGGRR